MLLIAVAVLTSCTSPEYKSTPGVNKWKLLSFGPQKSNLDSAEIAFINGEIYRNREIYPIRTFYSLPVHAASDPLWEVLKTRFSGDSLEYFSYAPDLLHPDSMAGDTLHYFLYIDRMRTKRQLNDARQKELLQLDSIVRSDSVANGYTEYRGIYYKILDRGDTAKVRYGKELLLQYRGQTLDGKVFDDSRRMDSPLRFVMGNDYQVLPGIELALEKMHRGDKARVIIPSWLAFGSEGSAGNRVPPYSAVIYEIEVAELAR